jgi:hypothetical protein
LKQIADNYGKVVRVLDPVTLLGHDSLRCKDQVVYRRFYTAFCLDDLHVITFDGTVVNNCQQNENLDRYFRSEKELVDLFPNFGYNIQDNLLNMNLHHNVLFFL